MVDGLAQLLARHAMPKLSMDTFACGRTERLADVAEGRPTGPAQHYSSTTRRGARVK